MNILDKDPAICFASSRVIDIMNSTSAFSILMALRAEVLFGLVSVRLRNEVRRDSLVTSFSVLRKSTKAWNPI